ncbi:alpha/beta hydrolase [Acidimicrobiaceae bacterium]|nr:alpha/beta hydrolase [Acidimicrobiaceae bacterium]
MEKININNVTLSYETVGEGRDILLLHGFPSNLFMWKKIKNDLVNNGYRVTIVEQRGYPLSRLDNSKISMFNITELSKDIEDLVKALKLDQNLTLVGHDWGSIVAWAIVSRENITIEKLISICGGTEFPTSNVYSELNYDGKPHYISSFQDVKKSSLIIDNNLESFFRSSYRLNNQNSINPDLSLENVFIKNQGNQSIFEDSDIDKLIKHFKGLSIDQPLSWYANIDLNFKLSAEWRKLVKTPVSFIFGEIDDAVKLNEKMFERLSQSGTNVTITEITGAGHWLPITHKESVLKEIYA